MSLEHLLAIFAVVAAVFGASQVLLRLLGGPVADLRALGQDCFDLFREAEHNATIEPKVFRAMTDRVGVLETRTHWPVKRHLHDLYSYLEETSWSRGDEREIQAGGGQDAANNLLRSIGRFERLTVGG